MLSPPPSARSWDEFRYIPDGPSQDGIYSLYNQEAGSFTIEWSRIRHLDSDLAGYCTFQAVLFDPAIHPSPTCDGKILMLYQQVANNDAERNCATVGIEAPSGREGIQYS